MVCHLLPCAKVEQQSPTPAHDNLGHINQKVNFQDVSIVLSIHVYNVQNVKTIKVEIILYEVLFYSTIRPTYNGLQCCVIIQPVHWITL